LAGSQHRTKHPGQEQHITGLVLPDEAQEMDAWLNQADGFSVRGRAAHRTEDNRKERLEYLE
jgi:hypothetical protein